MKDLKIFIWNANGLNETKLPELKNFTKNEDYDIIILTETYKINNEKQLRINEYKCEYKNRQGQTRTNKRGTRIYHKTQIGPTLTEIYPNI